MTDDLDKTIPPQRSAGNMFDMDKTMPGYRDRQILLFYPSAR